MFSRQAPPDAILGVTEAFKKSNNPNKINVGVGAYRDEQGKPVILSSVHTAEQRLLADSSANHEYLPMGGIPEFCGAAAKLAFGSNSAAIKEGRIATIQALSGTGSLRVGGEFLRRFYPKSKVVLIPNPSWANHRNIFERSSLQVQTYRYYDPGSRGLDFQGMLADIRNAPEGAILLLHACAHNPTGVDPTLDQWKSILEVARSRKLLPFFDSAYQGFSSGDLDRDAASIRLFVDAGLEILLAQSFAKNMGLYGERVGALSVVLGNAAVKDAVASQLKITARTMYSNPPKHGAAVATMVLTDPELFSSWKVELKGMADRIMSMRNQLKQELISLNTPGSWEHITNQIGMFSFTGLTPPQVELMTNKWAVFMTKDGRVSMAGLNSKNCKYMAEAICDAVKSRPSNSRTNKL